MSASLEDPSAWRLVTAGGIKYKFLGMTGEFEDEAASTSWEALIRASDLSAFLLEVFPPPTQVGNLYIPTPATMPGVPYLKAKKVSFKSWTDKPADPFGVDPTAASGTYDEVVQVTVNFGTIAKQDSTDPRTFLEISGNASSDFLNTQSNKAKWVPQKNSAVSGSTNPSDDNSVVNPSTGQTQGTVTDEDEESNTSRNIPAFVIVPQVEWNVTWSQIPYSFFRDYLVHRLRLLEGRVNSVSFPLLFDAEPETILFEGYTYSQQYTWRGGIVETPPVKVSLKFKEKRIMWRGYTVGHNHFWRPGVGWQKLLVDGVNTTYGRWDLNMLFQT